MAKITTIYDLNIDCLQNICSYLNPLDILKFVSVCDHYGAITTELDLPAMVQALTPTEAETALNRIGRCLKRMQMKSYSSSFVDYLPLLTKYCTNIKEIDCSSKYIRNREANTFVNFQNVIMSLKEITVLNLEYCKVTDDDCQHIATLTQLQDLNLSYNRRIRGKHLHKLVNLQHLNLLDCFEIGREEFRAICKATKLRSLNAAECNKLEAAEMEVLVETQTELEMLAIKSNFKGNFTGLGQMKHLKHLEFRGFECIYMLNAIADSRAEFLEKLEIYFYCYAFRDDSLHQQIMRFRNLKILAGVFHIYNDDFLRALGKACPKLEELDFSISWTVTSAGVLSAVAIMSNLKLLDISGCKQFDNLLYHQILAVFKKQNRTSPKLTLNVLSTGFHPDILETEEYKKNEHILALVFNSRLEYYDHLQYDLFVEIERKKFASRPAAEYEALTINKQTWF